MSRVKVVVVKKQKTGFIRKGEYLYTICAENGGWVRYQTLPACMGQGHRVNFSYNHVRINEQTTLKIWQGMFYCVNCKLMGTVNTMREYHCS
jgi:hypothetical protein